MRKWVLWARNAFLVLSLSCLLLAGLEAVLRVTGFGHSTHCLLKKTFKSDTFYVTNKAFYQQFFSLPIDTIWDGAEWQIPAHKPDNTFRIYIFGSSAAQGLPEPAYSFWRILEVMLRTCHPQTRFEVLSAARPMANSNVMRPAAQACAEHEPDLFVVYMGNNEVNGPFGAANARSALLSWPLPLIHARIALTDFRLGQLVSGNSKKLWRSDLKRVSQYFWLDDPRLDVVRDHYRHNLSDLCRSGVRAGASVLLCTLGCNLRDCPPDQPEHRSTLTPDALGRWDEFYRVGEQAESAAAYGDAIDSYLKALQIDDSHAGLHFHLGTCYEATGQHDKARTSFTRAYELDTFRSRAPAFINETIREVAREFSASGVHLIDTLRSLEAQSPYGLVGKDLIYDDVHLTFDGNYVLARAIMEQLEPLLPERVRGTNTPAVPIPSNEECRRRLALTPGITKQHIEHILRSFRAWSKIDTRWFEKQRAQIAEGEATIEKTIEGYRQALELCDRDYYVRLRYAEALKSVGRTEEALDAARILAAQFPYDRDAHRLLGVLLSATGHGAMAIQEFETTLAIYPGDAKTLAEWGRILEQTGYPADALAKYRSALRFDPNDEHVKCAEGYIMEGRGDIQGARDAYRRAILINPQSAVGYEHLDALLKKQGNAESRLKEWQQIVQEHPNAARGYLLLGAAYEAISNVDEAIVAYGNAVKQDGNDPVIRVQFKEAQAKKAFLAKCDEGQVLENQGDVKGAIEAYKQAIRMNPGDVAGYEHLDGLLKRPENAEVRLNEWRQVAQEHPDVARGYFLLGTAYEAVSNVDEAIEAYRKAVEQDDNDPAMRTRLEEAQAQKAFLAKCDEGQALDHQGDVKGAIEAYKQAIRMNPGDVAGYEYLDGLLKQQGNAEDRLSVWRQVVQEHPESARGHFLLGAACEAASDMAGAIAAYGKAVEQDGTDPAMRVNLGMALAHEGKLQDAAAVLRKALELNADMPAVRLKLIDIFCSLGQQADARKELAACQEHGVAVPDELRVKTNAGQP